MKKASWSVSKRRPSARRVVQQSFVNSFVSSSYHGRFSSVANLDSFHKISTQKLLNINTGFTSQMWLQAETLLRWWCSQHTPESVDCAIQILERMMLQRGPKTQQSTDSRLNADLLNVVVDNWRLCAKQQQETPSISVREMWTRIQTYYPSNSGLQANLKTYNMILDVAVSRVHQDPLLLQQLVDFLWDHPILRPDLVTLTTLLNTQSAAYADAVLERVLGSHSSLQPDRVFFGALLKAWAQSGHPRAVQKAESILHHMQQLHTRYGFDTQPDIAIYNAYLDCIVKTNGRDAAERAQAVLNQLCSKRNNPHIQPNAVTFGIVIHAWSRHANGGARRAMALLERMHRASLRPDVHTMTAVLKAWAQNNDPRAPQMAERVLHNLESSEATQPDAVAYTIVLNCWAQRGAADRAQAILNKMHTLSKTHRPNVKPDAQAYSSVIHAWAKSGKRGASDRAQALLGQMLEESREDPSMRPNIVTFGSVLHALAREGNREQDAVNLLNQMWSLHESGYHHVKPNVIIYNTVLNCLAKAGHQRAAEQAEAMLEGLLQQNDPTIQPDVVSFNTVIHAWATSRCKDAAQRAERVLMRMQNFANATGDASLRPNRVSYDSVLHALAKSRGRGSAGRKAEDILWNMLSNYRAGDVQCKPNVITFNTVLDCWAKSRGHGSAERAAAILEEMKSLYRAGEKDVRPDAVSYSTVINAWSRSTSKLLATEKAERLLRDMWEDCKAGNTSCRPNAVSYTSVVAAMVNNDYDPDRFDRAEAIIQEMMQVSEAGYGDSRPNVRTFGCLLSAVTKSQVPDKSRRVQRILNRMGKCGIEPDRFILDSLSKSDIHLS